VRQVPVDDDLWPRLREHVMKVPPGGLLWHAPRGGRLLYDHWRDRVWLKGLSVEQEMTEPEIEAWKAGRRAEGRRAWRPRWVVDVPLLADPQPTPHDLRHTYGTRLGEHGMPAHEIMALMGHADLESVQRYLHAREGRHERARAAMRRARGLSSP
jgi:integrase